MSASTQTTRSRHRRLTTKEALGHYGETIATLTAAITFAFLGILGVVGAKVVAAATLFVLAAVTGVMLRQRDVIEDVKERLDSLPLALDEVRAAIGRVDRTVEAVASDDAYDLLSHDVQWEIVAPDGSLAHASRHKRLRFNQHDVVSIYELGKASGGSPGRVEDWAFNKDEIEKVGQVSIGGEDYVLISLGRRYQRNDELDYTSMRTLRGLFTDPRNRVSHRVREHTYQLCVRVIWPKEGPPPKRVVVDESKPGGTSKVEEYRGVDLQTVEGRPYIERSYDRPPRGQVVAITWETAAFSASQPTRAQAPPRWPSE
jgi:hypothetical protein